MENDIIYFSDFPNLQETGTRKDNGKFDLTLLPTQELKEEFRGYIMYRCKNGTFRAYASMAALSSCYGGTDCRCVL